MQTLATLIRVHKHRLDGTRRELADLERLEADLIERRQALEDEIAAEQDSAKRLEVGAFAYGGFAQGAIQRRAMLDSSLADIRAKIATVRAALEAAFQELKRFEIALTTRERKARAERERRAQIQLDEMSLQMHRRRSG